MADKNYVWCMIEGILSSVSGGSLNFGSDILFMGKNASFSISYLRAITKCYSFKELSFLQKNFLLSMVYGVSMWQ